MREVVVEEKTWWGTRKRVSHVPESYAELDACRFLAWVEWVLSPSAERGVRFLSDFLGIKRRFLLWMDDFQRYKLGELASFLPEMDAGTERFIIPSFPGPGMFEFSPRLHAPGDRLSGVCLQQFMTVDTYYSYYVVTQREEFLNLLVAALYLLPGECYVPHGGRGKPLDLQGRSAYVGTLPYASRYAVFVNWSLVKSWLGHLFPSMFPCGEAEGKPKPVDWLSLFDAFVGEHVAEMGAYQSMACMDAFRVMDRKIKEGRK